MHVKDIKATVPKVAGVAVRVGGYIGRHKRASIVVAVGLLLFAPLLTGDGELFVLNALGLGFGALLLRRFARPGGRRTGRGQRTRQATRAQQTAKATQHEGGHDDDGNNDDWWDWDKAAAKPRRAGRPADGGAVQG